MLSKNLENSTSYDIFYKFLKKARVYYTLSISRGGGPRPPAPPPWIRHCNIYREFIEINKHTKTIYRYLQELTAAHIIIDKGYLRTEQTEVSILIVNWTNI